MELIKTSEKVLIWMHREGLSQKQIGDKLGQTRQAISQKIKDNSFTQNDIIKLQTLGLKL